MLVLRVEIHRRDPKSPSPGLNLALRPLVSDHGGSPTKWFGRVLLTWVLPTAEQFHFLLELDSKGPNLRSSRTSGLGWQLGSFDLKSMKGDGAEVRAEDGRR